MLQGILDFCEMCLDTISDFVDFLVSFLSDLVYLVECFYRTIAAFPTYIVWLPDVLVSSLVASLSLLVILRIAGRD